MKQIFIIIILFISTQVFGQTNTVEGTISDENNKPLIGANVFIKGSYNGATTDINGFFKLEYPSNDSCYLIIRFIGYKQQEIHLSKSNPKSLLIKMYPDTDLLDEVVITAGSFEASDKKRAVLLDAIDIATTASAEGDIYGALTTFPGATLQGETGEIIVRGGDAHESKTYMDGVLVSSPYTSSYPDLPSRGRFAPFMFNGVSFSTGGYSAEYGQALSSVLELKTPGQFEDNLTSLMIMNVGLGLSHTQKWENTSVSAEANYHNLAPYFLMAKHELDWIKIPENFNGNMQIRQKVGKSGLLKAYAGYNYSTSKLNYKTPGNETTPVELTNNNTFIQTVYNTELKNRWMLKAGIGFNTDFDNTQLVNGKVNNRLSSLHTKLGFQKRVSDNLNIRFGSELITDEVKFSYNNYVTNETHPLSALDNIAATYVEADAMLSRKIAIRAGLRGEYSTLIHKANVTPRLSMAYKLDETSQFSMAYGSFYQQTKSDYLKYSTNLHFEKANHYILNYQYQKNKRLFRTELYVKSYDNLVTYDIGEIAEYENIGNNGFGYARGLDVFLRDKKTFKFVDYWISYSFIDSKRKYKNYREEAVPDFVSHHNFSAVYKQWIPLLTTQLSLTYSFSSGRSYNNPNSEEFMGEKTSPIHDLSGSLSYVTELFGQYTVVHLSVNNILGLDKVYSYRYTPDENSSSFTASPVKSLTQRTIILGVFISFK